MALLEHHALCMQVGLLRLTALAAKLGPGSTATGGARLMLWFLQCLLAHSLSAVNTLVAGEVQAALGPRPDVMDRYLGKGAAFCSRQARRPGKLSPKSCMAASVGPRLPQSGALSHARQWACRHLLDRCCQKSANLWRYM